MTAISPMVSLSAVNGTNAARAKVSDALNFSRPAIINVRRARHDDPETIPALMAQLGYDVPAPAIAARLRRLGERGSGSETGTQSSQQTIEHSLLS